MICISVLFTSLCQRIARCFPQARCLCSENEGCTYCFIHEEAHTNIRFISCDEHQLYERGIDLEVEGVRYIEMHRGPTAYVLGPPPSRGREFELESGVNACHIEYVYESRDSHVQDTE